MVHCVFYTPQQEDGSLLTAAVRNQAAFETEVDVICKTFHSTQEAADYLNEQDAAILGWDVSEETGRKALLTVRAHSRDAFLLVIAGSNTSPLTFLNPAIAPSSLIIRPLLSEELKRVAKEILVSLRDAEEDMTSCFVITNKNEQFRLPYHRIYYFEARGRKLYARLRREEIGFTGTLEQLENALPNTFQRCHRSYIVNTGKIDRVLLAQNTICMQDGLSVPLSRSFKRAIKERNRGDC